VAVVLVGTAEPVGAADGLEEVVIVQFFIKINGDSSA